MNEMSFSIHCSKLHNISSNAGLKYIYVDMKYCYPVNPNLFIILFRVTCNMQ